MRTSHGKIVICVRDKALLKQLDAIAKPYFEVIGCTDPEITAQSIVPSEISIFVTDSVALLRRSRQMIEDRHRILVTDYGDMGDIADGVNDKTVHDIVQIPIRPYDFLDSLLTIFPAPRVDSR